MWCQRPHEEEAHLSLKCDDFLILLSHLVLQLLKMLHQDHQRTVLQSLRPMLTLVNIPMKYLLLSLPLVHSVNQLVDHVTLNFKVVGHQHEVLVNANKGALEPGLDSHNSFQEIRLQSLDPLDLIDDT